MTSGKSALVPLQMPVTKSEAVGQKIVAKVTVTDTYDTINSESVVRFFWKLKRSITRWSKKYT